MAYELHIERPEREIALEEWQGAVARTPGLRLADSDAVGVNSRTNEAITIRGSGADAEVLFRRGGLLGLGARDEWVRVFRFFRSRASFKPGDTASPTDPVRKSAAQLAKALGAVIVGDEGERYEW